MSKTAGVTYAISLYIRRYNIHKATFVALFALLGLLSSIFISSISDEPSQAIGNGGFIHDFTLIVVAPILETVLFQLVPYIFTERTKAGAKIQFALMSLPFSLMHYHAGITGVADALVGGILLTLTFLTWKADGIRCATWMTASVHILHNALWWLVWEKLQIVA